MVYPDYVRQTEQVRRLREKRRVRVVGNSLCGRHIYAVLCGEARGCPLIAAGFHGMEYLTVAAALRFAEEYSGSAVIVPCVNPDGVDIAVHGAAAAGVYAPFVASTGMADRWQANARGVDINHNFDAAWQCVKRRECAAGINAPCATRFGGCHAESEPETRALTAFCRQRNPSRVLALHSQGREIYWDFGQHTPRESLPLAQKMSEVSGYRVASPEPMATGGGFKDWFISRFHRCGFTVEMGLGQNPLPLRDFEAEYPLVKAILLTFLHGG
ncbi:MAG: gamma-D-glutamyl-meso-diaminopimelate peptidase [Ruminococcus sp.]|nr:gamma-D-glutamyl-meso-diaminopimelate peptidase [Ruminococcus sp.]